MALSSAHTCTLQSIIHDDGSLQKPMAVRPARGCRKYDEPNRRGAPEETATSFLYPINVRTGQQHEVLHNCLEADAGVSWQVSPNNRSFFATVPSSHPIPHADCIEESQARRPPGLPLTALLGEYSLSTATIVRYVNEECAIRGVSATGFCLHHAETKGALR